MYNNIYIYMCIYIQKYMCVDIYIYTYIYIYMYVYEYTCVCVFVYYPARQKTATILPVAEMLMMGLS